MVTRYGRKPPLRRTRCTVTLAASIQFFSGSWQVRQEVDAPSAQNALCQAGITEFPAIQLGDGVFTNLTLPVRFMPISRQEDQAGGLIFRVQDARNYYILRPTHWKGT